ncbi:dicarboxylate/amino acid:cation symporter [soil metagenome]
MAAAVGSQTRILVGLVAGAALGSLVNYLVAKNPELKPAVDWVLKYIMNPVGQIFINLLFLAIIPLVFASLAVGVTRLGGGENVGRIGLKTIAYFIITTACAAVIGLTLVNQFRPGDAVDDKLKNKLMDEYTRDHAEKDRKPANMGIETLINVVPKNPLKSFVEKDMLSLIFTALLVGAALTRIDPSQAKVLIDILEAVNAVTDCIIRVAMAVAPFGVFALIFLTTAKFGTDLLLALAAFMGTVLGGLAIQLFIVFPILVKVLGGMSPITFFVRSKAAMITAFSTSSSSATLPTAMKTAEDELGVPANVSRFVLPLSASMNHNGTALFEAVTAVFLCQVFGVDLTLQQEIVVLLLCVLTATGMAGVPGGSLPLIGMVVASVTSQVPAAAIGIVIGVDRILDMCRTMVNVTGDLTTTLYVSRSERDKIAALTSEVSRPTSEVGTPPPAP